MEKTTKLNLDDQISILKYLLVIELWRGGLKQSEIKKRVKLASNTVNAMLKGLSRSASSDEGGN